MYMFVRNSEKKSSRLRVFAFKNIFSELNFLVIVNNFLESHKERKLQSKRYRYL